MGHQLPVRGVAMEGLGWLADWLIKMILKFNVPDGVALFGFLKIGDFHNAHGFFGAVNMEC